LNVELQICIFPEVGHKMMILNARKIAGKVGVEEQRLVLVAIEDRSIPAQDRQT